MKFLNSLSLVILSVVLTACGGGGGSAGSSGTTGGTAAAASAPTIAVAIVDSAFNMVTGNSVGSGALFYAQATVRDASAAVVPNKLVIFSTDATVATLAAGSALTDAGGIARVQISPVNLSAVKSGSLAVSATVNDTPVSSGLDFQTAAANVTLANIAAVQRTLTALQSTAVTVEARVNGALAGNGVVTVNFVATCGSFSPSSAATNSAGIVNTVYQSAVSCAGPVVLSAQAAGATTVTDTVTLTPASATNVVYTSATTSLMVTSQASSGLKQSTVKFQVLDANGAGMSGQAVDITLGSAAISSGVKFSGDVTAAQAVTTDASGFAQVTVKSGSLPSPVQVTAALHSTPSLQASSNGISVASGVPTQDSASISADKLSIEAWNIDGVQAIVTWRVSDRQGNPIPAGAVVNFVTRSNSNVQATCTIGNNSSCSVNLTSAGLRPTNGRAVILAYMDGEESFIDQNGDNVWQIGEPFSDVGGLYLDSNENGAYDAASEQTYPGGLTGTLPCAAAPYSYPSVANTCDGTWSSGIRVRRQIVIALATSNAALGAAVGRTDGGFSVNIADGNGNGMPTGTTVAAKVTTTGSACAVTTVSPNVVRNSPNQGVHAIILNGDPSCAAAKVEVTVTSPAGFATTSVY